MSSRALPRTLLVLLALALGAGCASSTPPTRDAEPDGQELDRALPGEGADAGRTVVYRDDWGAAHIYAPTVPAGLYAMGWAQADDRAEQLLTNLKIALGEYAEIVGAAGVPVDVRNRLFAHARTARETARSRDVTDAALISAFARGIDDWLRAHPDRVPAWWGERTVEPWMIDAFGRLFLYSWSVDEGLGDLRRAGIDVSLPVARRASNQWAVAPERSANGHAMLLIDPHLDWWGPSRFWEVRIHAGALVGSGVTLAGSPWIGLGHNASVAWAMTTGGPDTADAFELTLDPARPDSYLFDGTWREMRIETETIAVAGEPDRTVRMRYSHHGPVVAVNEAGDRAWAVAIAYGADADRNAAWRDLNLARDVSGVVAATRHLAMFPQNVMAADTAGNLYYQRTGRVPVRAADLDPSLPLDGSTSATAWQGFHDASELLQLLNPPQGYMQNCNIPPDAMIVDSPLQPGSVPDYVYSAEGYGPSRSGWINQRGARALELLSGDDSVTVDDMLSWATDVRPFGVDRWVGALDTALTDTVLSDAERAVLDGLVRWDGRLTRDSAPALHYLLWREAVLEVGDEAVIAHLRDELDPWYRMAEGRLLPLARLDPEAFDLLAGAFRLMASRLIDLSDGARTRWGDVHRVGRDASSWPVGGGGGDALGVTTLRTMGYRPPDAEGLRHAYRGQTSTQVVELSTPIRSWGYLPVGQSDDPASPHYDDQASGPFSERTLRPSNWLPEDLAHVARSRTVLDGAP